MTHQLPPLPYPEAALEPHISARTLSFHYGKHHQAYVNNLNNLLKGHALEHKSLDEVIKATAGKIEMASLFNNAAQIWNHTFYWQSMKKSGGGKPNGEIAKKIDSDLGGYEKFCELFKTAGATQFGSGWAWLTLEQGKLKVIKTHDAELPMTMGQQALITMDVWEHAYYIDYQNRRPDYIQVFLDHLINWDFANANLMAVMKS